MGSRSDASVYTRERFPSRTITGMDMSDKVLFWESSGRVLDADYFDLFSAYQCLFLHSQIAYFSYTDTSHLLVSEVCLLCHYTILNSFVELEAVLLYNIPSSASFR